MEIQIYYIIDIDMPNIVDFQEKTRIEKVPCPIVNTMFDFEYRVLSKTLNNTIDKILDGALITISVVDLMDDEEEQECLDMKVNELLSNGGYNLIQLTSKEVANITFLGVSNFSSKNTG